MHAYIHVGWLPAQDTTTAPASHNFTSPQFPEPCCFTYDTSYGTPHTATAAGRMTGLQTASPAGIMCLCTGKPKRCPCDAGFCMPVAPPAVRLPRTHSAYLLSCKPCECCHATRASHAMCQETAHKHIAHRSKHPHHTTAVHGCTWWQRGSYPPNNTGSCIGGMACKGQCCNDVHKASWLQPRHHNSTAAPAAATNCAESAGVCSSTPSPYASKTLLSLSRGGCCAPTSMHRIHKQRVTSL